MSENEKYIKSIQEYVQRNPMGLWQDNPEAAASRKWMRENAPEEFDNLFLGLSEEQKRQVPEQFRTHSMNQKWVQNRTSEGISEFGSKYVMPTVLGAVGGPAGAAGGLANTLLDIGINGATKGERDSWGDLLANRDKRPGLAAFLEFTNPLNFMFPATKATSDSKEFARLLYDPSVDDIKNLRFIRNTSVIPTIDLNGKIKLSPDGQALTNMTWDQAVIPHSKYVNHGDYMVIDPKAFRGKRFGSIEPMDSFTFNTPIESKYTRIISGSKSTLSSAKSKGYKVNSSGKIKRSYKKVEDEFSAAMAEYNAPTDGINLRKPPKIGEMPSFRNYQREVNNFIRKKYGIVDFDDVRILERITGMKAGTEPYSSFSKRLDEFINSVNNATNKNTPSSFRYPNGEVITPISVFGSGKTKVMAPLKNAMYEKLGYHPATSIEQRLLNKYGISPHPTVSDLSEKSFIDILENLGSKIIKKNGGTISFKKGGSIHIKPSNKGKFTDYCGGKVTEECIQRGKNSSNPTTRKRANFAANARKWKHMFGGTLPTILKLGGK